MHSSGSWICHAGASRSGGFNVILFLRKYNLFPEEKSSLRLLSVVLGAVTLQVSD